MVEKDFIKDLFADKLANAEAPVNPELWNAISAKVATQTTVSAGLSTTAKLIIGLGTAATITVASVLYFNQSEEKTSKEDPKALSSIQQENSQEEAAASENLSQSAVSEENKKAGQGTISKEEKQLQQQEQNEILAGPVIYEEEEYDNPAQVEEKIVLEPVKPVSKGTKENPNNGKAATQGNVTEKTQEKPAVEIGELPNVFTPNNDNENDYFFIPVKGLQDFALTILDQNNEVVFRTTDPNFKWDGRDAQGNLVASGTKFVYFFTGKSSQGDTISRHNKLEIRY